jgi:carbohydrate binding protein with CBM11 domain
MLRFETKNISTSNRGGVEGNNPERMKGFMKEMKCWLFMTMFAFAAVSGIRADEKLVADFNAPAPNNLGGNYGAFGPENEDGNACKAAVDDNQKRGEGSSLRLDYNVSKKGVYNGFWMKLGPQDNGNNLDVSQYKTLCLWVKGDEKSGIPGRFKIEVKGDSGPVAKKYIGELKDKWTKVEIPLLEFQKQGVDLTKLNELCIVFEQPQAGPVTVGAINIDDIVLEK